QQLQNLAGHAGVVTTVALGAQHFDAFGLSGFGNHVQPAISVGIVVADKAQGFDVLLDHGISQGASHQLVILRSLEHPGTGAFHRINNLGVGSHTDHGSLGFASNVHHGQGAGRHGGTDHHVDLVVGNQLAHIAYGHGGIGSIVQNDVLDFLADHFSRQQ